MIVPFTKTFNPGEILTAGDVNEHLLNGGYQFREQVRFTSSGQFVKADFPWLRAIRVRCVGGGGSAGAIPVTSPASAAAAGSGGGGGGYAESFITDVAGLAASVTVTRGAGGGVTSAGNNNGQNGEASSFGSLVIGNGGSLGLGMARTTGRNGNSGGFGGGGTGDLVIEGQRGGPAYVQDGIPVSNPFGGSSALAPGAHGPVTAFGIVDRNGFNFGGGGGGPSRRDDSSAQTGGSGANGIVIVDLFA